MKTQYTHILIGLMATGAMTMAGTVSIPNSFSAGTTAKASEVNANFSTVKTAVNGNAGEIATNKTAISNKVASVTAASSGGIQATRTGNDVELKRANGHISISSRALQPYSKYIDTLVTVHECHLNQYSSLAAFPNPTTAYVYFQTNNSSDACSTYAGVQLPDGATITDMTCYVYRKGTTATPQVSLNRYTISNGEMYTIASATISQDGNDPQKLEPTIGTSYDTVENDKYAYALYFAGGGKTKTDGDKVRFYSCTIGYEY